MKPIILAAALAAAALPALALPQAALAAPPVYTGVLSDLAADGYDVVAYFTDGKPVKGDAKFAMQWKGATWRFASAQHLAAFKANPDRYAPQYGGYCAWAVAHGYTAKGDPTQWRIVNGKLYLNYNADIQSKWVKDIPGHIRQGDANWPRVLSK